MRHILAVDDDSSFLRVLAYQLRAMGFEVTPFLSPQKALAYLQEENLPDAVITDLRMPGMDGLELLDQILHLEPRLPVIILTAHGSSELAGTAKRQGAFDFLNKPFEKEELEQSLRNALQLRPLA